MTDQVDHLSVAVAIASHPFAAGFSPVEVGTVAEGAQLVEVRAGDLVIEEGRAADHAYLLLDGLLGLELHVPHRGAVVVGTVAPGELLGWSWMLPPATWRFDARARTDARLVALDGAHLRRACAEDHRLDRLVTHQVVDTLARRLEAARHQLVDVYRRGPA
jgi:CRP/FNR family cyclic AMP-dependent transcriptional regulator